MVFCLIVGCGSRTGAAHKHREKVNFKLFRVPRVITGQGKYVEELTTDRRRQWISAISRADLSEEKLTNERVCGKHFVSGQPSKDWDKFNVDWVPSINLGHNKKEVAGTGAQRAERAKRSARRRKLREHAEPVVSKKVKRDPPDDLEQDQPENCPIEPVMVPASTEVLDAPEDLEQDQPENCPIEPVMVPASTEVLDAPDSEMETQTPSSSDKCTQTTEFAYLFMETKAVQDFTENYFTDCRDSDDRVRFYTGLPAFDTLKIIFDFVAPNVSRKTKTLTPFQEFVMVLVKLRLNPPQQDLAYRFNISQPTVSRVFWSWMIVMDIRLTPLIKWPEREAIIRTMPACFRDAFGSKVTIIIDCFEVFIERPSNLLARGQTFSNYKNHNTVKVLVGITPQGSICFVSRTWGGRTSDKHLTSNCGLLDKLKPGDLVMADRGFTIEESLSLHQVKLAIPTFTRGSKQLDPADIEQTRGIANVRIHVERVIGQLKQKYTMLQGTLEIHYVSLTAGSTEPMVDKIVRVCSALANLCPSVVPFT
ncbi:uncharacterized protein LOC118413732 [Branchiostoma floridae]|uniref:Uncharacterized protein LOC118413732 n=1 Tax=Branchiostoma floridae TaxID=7739 RepID=A0A9J7KZ38_BRAFL|nr:uncharacterized protein LOC118413732 [Branchiostoma floridae]